MSGGTIDVEGLRELQREAIRIAKAVAGGPIVQAVKKATLIVLRDARINAPIDTGRLRASIIPTVTVSEGVVTGVVGSNVVYAGFQEIGTSRMPGRFYLRRAIEDNRARIARIIDTAVARIVR